MKKRKIQKRNFLEEQYSESINYLVSSRRFIYSIILVFFLFSFIGYIAPTPVFLEDLLKNALEELISKTEGMSQSELIKFIFLNNAQTSLIGLLSGLFLGFFSVGLAITNGYLLGFVSKMVVPEEGFLVLWKLLPHGIFELPAVFISLGLGLKFGTFIFQEHVGESFKDYLKNSLRVFILIVIPLLIIAAFIEGTLISLAANTN